MRPRPVYVTHTTQVRLRSSGPQDAVRIVPGQTRPGRIVEHRHAISGSVRAPLGSLQVRKDRI